MFQLTTPCCLVMQLLTVCVAVFSCENEQWLTKSLQTDLPAIETPLSCSRDTSLDCPWVVCSNGSCTCSDIHGDPLKCAADGSIEILNCYCITYSENTTQVGMCIFNCFNGAARHYSVYSKLSNESLCSKYNREGTLCGQCMENTYPLAYSFNLTCVSCPSTTLNWIKYFSISLVPLTCFYFIIIIFRVNIVSSHLHGFVIYSQAVSMPVMARSLVLLYPHYPQYLVDILRVMVAICGVWNLDFARSFDLGICLRASPLMTLSLDFIVALYPLLLMLLSYLLITLYDRRCKFLIIFWKPFKHVLAHFSNNWDVKTSLIDSFATFFILTYVKFLSVSCDLLLPVQVYSLSPAGSVVSSSTRPFYDATLTYFGETHRPYVILAIITIVFFVIIPALVLLLYPLRVFQKLLNTIPGRWYVLHTFIDSLQGCFKDGTEPGTRDCRWFFHLFIFSRFVVFTMSIFSNNSMFFTFASILLPIFSILFLIVEPFKLKFHHVTDSNAKFLLFLALFYAAIIGRDLASVQSHSITTFFSALALFLWCLPLLYVSILTLKWIISHRKFGLELFRRWQTRRRGYEQMLE